MNRHHQMQEAERTSTFMQGDAWIIGKNRGYGTGNNRQHFYGGHCAERLAKNSLQFQGWGDNENASTLG